MLQTRYLNIRMVPELYDKIQKLAKKNGKTISQQCRDILINHFEPKQKPKQKRFVKPTLGQVVDYMAERGCHDQKTPERFIDYYTSNGWMVGGKSPMKDWKAAVRNWLRNDYYSPAQKQAKAKQSAQRINKSKWAEGKGKKSPLFYD